MLLLASPYVFRQLTGGLEWSWLVLVTVSFVGALLEERRTRVGSWRSTAFLAVLVRVDLAIFVAIFTLALCGAIVRVVAVGRAGASAAILLTALNSWFITGHWMPNAWPPSSSGRARLEFLPAVSWTRLMRVTGPGLVLTDIRVLALSLRTFLAIGAFAAGAAAMCATSGERARAVSVWRSRQQWRSLRMGWPTRAASTSWAITTRAPSSFRCSC